MATVERQQTDLVTLEIDGQAVQAPKGSMIIEAADRIGIDIPRFCYHHKLSIAANCRMCLVDVEKAPKPLPACATPVGEGMKVFTESRRAVDAQRGVMEFLLINHPLDCPICDQGGECELQDLAMGYGRSVSRFTERKRVVKDKNLGPLVSTDMTRCIHCTRCVRFLEEIAGTAELGGIGRGEHTEISTFVERNIQSELSGNIIDLCPVGALTNKPFRFSARPWEMRARALVGSHDCLGSNLYYHVRGRKIMRCVPRDNEAINECWLADRDRYSHFGLEAEDRLTAPKIKIQGQWQDCDWTTALDAAAAGLRSVIDQHGPEQLGVLVSPRATTEEHHLLRRLSDGLGCSNIDHRVRMVDSDHPLAGKARMDVSSAEISKADAIFLIGSNIRQDQPILGHRVRTAWRLHGARIMDLNPVAYDFHFDLAERITVAPQAMVQALARVTRAALAATDGKLPDGPLGELLAKTEADAPAERTVAALQAADRAVLLLGDGALNHPQASQLRALAECLAERLQIFLCVLPGPANSQGAWRAGTVPGERGLAADAMLSDPRQSYLLVDLEPSLDTAHPARAMGALGAAETVVAVTSFAGPDLLEVADVLLPMAAVPETDGSYINLDGTDQAFRAAIKPPFEAREGWKILRRLGEMLGLEGFDFVSLEAVVDSLQADATTRTETDAQSLAKDLTPPAVSDQELARIGDVPMFAGDALVRRSRPLQQTSHADAPVARLHPATAERLGLSQAQRVRVRQDQDYAEAAFELRLDSAVAVDALWLPVAVPEVASLGPAYGPISLEADRE
ncbi:NADH-quinone oxidoreductase subunit NuoG [Wenzhouxiangella limi]|uniref:NADH-quinone oxidoreductase n=1 Tax=Wenzhouxiangella limi TaxID=2707351 RepID=A0A845UW56_9GAMM|nr:NADH-quinone oxidoreductase subunit NuoG [Wenzhouxiangella limi]NDY96073.1 NADH-quinone oxidoreductase subunit G [Wenzhouxiangella limi]